MKKIAIQGTLGSYHDIAAHKYFEGEEIELICCANFEDVFTSIRKDSQVIGMLAIENTIAGSYTPRSKMQLTYADSSAVCFLQEKMEPKKCVFELLKSRI